MVDLPEPEAPTIATTISNISHTSFLDSNCTHITCLCQDECQVKACQR